ncbi:acetyltransferase [Halobacillus halophilus]|uniref:Uncharacterized protein n=2 Tax=Halobacillus halophilus TaxID=1570 RepID=I0JL46_HALH3|nr:acetyltransferase [Halobacillus halophilus]CCG44866.1 hypothetical protein HBHAL_2521 [Halobacillus halophilus DSM 2266]
MLMNKEEEKMSSLDKCPKCDNKELKKGIVNSSFGVVHMFPIENQRSQSSPISSMYCAKCGYILEWYVDNPE